MNNKVNNLFKIIGIMLVIGIIGILLINLLNNLPMQNSKDNDKLNEINLDDKLKRLTTKGEQKYRKNDNGENVFPIEINWLIYPEKDKDMELLLGKINHIFNKIYDSEVNNDMFNDIDPKDPILEGLFLDFNIKLESINSDTVVFRIEEEGHLGATGMYGNYYCTFNKNDFEQVKLEKNEKHIEKVVDEVNKSGNLLGKSRDEIVNEMYMDGNWYMLDNKVIFIIEQDGVNPPLYIEVDK